LHHDAYARGIHRRHEQMHMVRHEDVRVHLTFVPLARGAKALVKEFVVGIRGEERGSVVAALDDVLRNAGRGITWQTCQDSPDGTVTALAAHCAPAVKLR
jgi:ribosomal protein L18